MKKTLAILLFVCSSTAAFAGNYGPAGCGLGSMVFDAPADYKNAIKQVIAGTLNGTGSQSFGITSGTSHCDATALVKVAALEVFVEANKVALANDAARGQGETLNAAARILGCTDTAAFGAEMQNRYSSVFASAEASVNDVSRGVVSVAKSACMM